MPSTTTSRASARRRARALVLQGLYQRRLSRNASADVRADLVASEDFARSDADYFDELWRGVSESADAIVEGLAPSLDRKPAEVSPIESAILAIGAWELAHRPDIPYRVVINEAVELAKSYGGTDGHKFVNGVLDRHAAGVRGAEIAALARERGIR
ncbi:MAG: transcription antitermination factor NusB [Betaproteobacteria bacterium]